MKPDTLLLKFDKVFSQMRAHGGLCVPGKQTSHFLDSIRGILSNSEMKCLIELKISKSLPFDRPKSVRWTALLLVWPALAISLISSSHIVFWGLAFHGLHTPPKFIGAIKMTGSKPSDFGCPLECLILHDASVLNTFYYFFDGSTFIQLTQLAV